jgi:glycosyltransferase involved in cell wall biosynthesis
MSVYNGKRYVAEAIESILAQTYSDFEFLIMDDASTDESVSIVEKYASLDSRIKFFSHAKNTGLTKSLNELAKYATGEYIARMDADDVADPTRIEKQMYFLMQHPEVSVCGTRGWLMNEDTGEESFLDVPVGVLSKKQLIYHNQCLHPSLVIKRSVFDLVGGYDERFKRSQDYELLLRILRVASIANIPDRLIRYRFSSKSFLKYGKKQEWYALCARVRAIMMGGYPIVYGVFWIVLRFLWLIVPQSIKFSKMYGDRKKS